MASNNDDDASSNVSSHDDDDDEHTSMSTALVESKQADNLAVQAQQHQQEQQQLLVQVAQVQEQFSQIYPTVLATTTKFNELSRAAQLPAATFHGQLEDGSAQDVLLSDHYRNSTHTRARHVFDVCQSLSRLLKQLPIKRVKAQEHLKFQVCEQLQEIVARSDGLARPMMLALTLAGEEHSVLSSDIRAKVPRDFLRPMEFNQTRVMTIQRELAEVEAEMVAIQAEYDSFSESEIDAVHATPVQLKFKPHTKDSDKHRFSDICLCVSCSHNNGSLLFMDVAAATSATTLEQEVKKAVLYESTVETDTTFERRRLKWSGVDNCAIVRGGREATPVTEESKQRLAKFTAEVDAAVLHGAGVRVDTKLDPLHVPLKVWAKFIPVANDVDFEISYLTDSCRLRVMVSHKDQFTETDLGVVFAFKGSIFGGMPVAYMQEAKKRMTYRSQWEPHYKSGQVVEDDGTSLIINPSVVANNTMLRSVEETKEVTQTVVEGNTTTTTTHKIVTKAEMKTTIKKMWQQKSDDLEDLHSHWKHISKLLEGAKQEKRNYELQRMLPPARSFRCQNIKIRALQDELADIDRERKDVKIANTHADLALYRTQLGQYKRKIHGFVTKGLSDLTSHPNLEADPSTAIMVGALTGGQVVDGNKLMIDGQSKAIDLPRDWQRTHASKMFSAALTTGKNAIFPHIAEITTADMESDVLAKVQEQETVKNQVRAKVRELMLRQRGVDKQLHHPNNRWIINQEMVEHKNAMRLNKNNRK